jgi:hypothetical protein
MAEQAATAAQQLLRTSIAEPSRHPREVTVQFLRYTNVGMTAYQKGQCAGFLREMAEKMAERGACRILVMAEPGAQKKVA